MSDTSTWADVVARNIASAPPLSPAQRDSIAALLAPVAIPVHLDGGHRG